MEGASLGTVSGEQQSTLSGRAAERMDNAIVETRRLARLAGLSQRQAALFRDGVNVSDMLRVE